MGWSWCLVESFKQWEPGVPLWWSSSSSEMSIKQWDESIVIASSSLYYCIFPAGWPSDEMMFLLLPMLTVILLFLNNMNDTKDVHHPHDLHSHYSILRYISWGEIKDNVDYVDPENDDVWNGSIQHPAASFQFWGLRIHGGPPDKITSASLSSSTGAMKTKRLLLMLM